MNNLELQLPRDPAALKLQLLKLQSQLNERAKSSDHDSVEFAYSCIRRISDIRGSQLIDIRYECAERCVPYFYASTRLDYALDAAVLMLDLGKRAQRTEWVRRGRTYIGVIHGELGNVACALTEYLEALRLAEDINDVHGIASTLLNLGTSFIYGGLYTNAKQCFAQVLRICSEANVVGDLPSSASANLAQAHLYCGEHHAAYESICRALEASVEPRTLKGFHSKTIHELTFVRIAVMIGRLAEAAEHAANCHEFAIRAGGALSIANAKLAKGLVDCFAGDTAAGLHMLEEELHASAAYGVVARVVALDILARGCQACGRPDLALPHIQEVLSSVRAQRERELQVLVSSNSLRRIGDERDLQALTCAEASIRAAAVELELANAQHDMLERLAITATLKDDISGAHGYRVGSLSALLARDLGWTTERCHKLEMAARLHDIGKVAIADSVTLSDRAFEPAQRQIMRSHTRIGAELLGNHLGSTVRLAAEVAQHHHEWWDGTGYPGGLAGNRIPISCRIVALADVFDALTHGRRYAPASTCEEALCTVQALSGLQFDPDLTPIFQSLVRRLVMEHASLDDYLGAGSRLSAFFSARKKIEAMVSRDRSTIENGD